MMKPKPRTPVDPHKSPWMSWLEGSRTVTVCKYCLQHYNRYAAYESDNHLDTCEWWNVYVAVMTTIEES